MDIPLLCTQIGVVILAVGWCIETYATRDRLDSAHRRLDAAFRLCKNLNFFEEYHEGRIAKLEAREARFASMEAEGRRLVTVAEEPLRPPGIIDPAAGTAEEARCPR
jgi:hypothetical protein